ncbi:MAG: iron-sulfur cluster assembly accessory protein, partial [Pseudomonadota bacterium]
MFAVPGQDPVKMTEAAVRRIRKLMDGGEVKGLRIGVKKGGCAGMEYTMEHATEIAEHDAVVERDGARV